VTIDLDSLTFGIGAGVLDTGAPISAQDVWRMAGDCAVLPVLLGSDGIPLDVGRAIRSSPRSGCVGGPIYGS